jgi:hypothetical protein
MADIALVTANKVEIVESFEQMTLPTAETVHPGQVARVDASLGKFTKGNVSSATEEAIYGIATGGVANVAGQPITCIRKGVLDGFDLSGLDYWAPVYLSATDGGLADAPDDYGDTIVGRVIPGTSTTLGTAYDKLLLVDIPLRVA